MSDKSLIGQNNLKNRLRDALALGHPLQHAYLFCADKGMGIQAAEDSKTPVIGAEAGTVEGGAVATLGIDYTELGRQTGEMALRILRDGEDPATTAVETAKEFTYMVNEDAAERQGVTIPEAILNEAETV